MWPRPPKLAPLASGRSVAAAILVAAGTLGTLTMCSGGSKPGAGASEAGSDGAAVMTDGAVEGSADQAAADSSDASPSTACPMTGPPPALDDPDASLGLVPVSVVDESGSIRFAVWVSINGVWVQAMLDTGAPGLRVLGSAIADAGVTALDSGPLQIDYNGGLVLGGYAASASVGLQGLATPIADVPMQVVTSACDLQFDAQAPDGSTPCNPATPTIFGMSATLGISLRQSRTTGAVTLRSPLASLGGYPPFIVHLNGTSATVGGDAGTIEIGVTAAERATFPYWIHLTGGPAPVWNDLSPQSCIRDETADGGCWTQGTFLDTGNDDPYIETLDAGAPTPGARWPSADTAAIALLGDNGCVIDQYDVPAGTVAVRKLAPGTTTENNVGYGVFYHVDILFDPASGWIGMRPR